MKTPTSVVITKIGTATPIPIFVPVERPGIPDELPDSEVESGKGNPVVRVIAVTSEEAVPVATVKFKAVVSVL
jgi:hypothetical protein